MSAVIDKHYGPNLTCRCLELTSGVIVVEPKKGQIEKFKEIIKTIIERNNNYSALKKILFSES